MNTHLLSTPSPIRIRAHGIALLAALVAWLLPPTPLVAQTRCGNQGAALVPANWERGMPLQCPIAPSAPAWHLFTPSHREVVAKPGFRQGDARALPRILVGYRCTGLLFPAVVVDRVRTMGYVLDVAELPCIPPLPTVP